MLLTGLGAWPGMDGRNMIVNFNVTLHGAASACSVAANWPQPAGPAGMAGQHCSPEHCIVRLLPAGRVIQG